ncbi:glycosyltransferase family 4 protein [Aurantimonas sp. C2-6-R+9]|uniref:glycosyltransferase family 4 protein n=1 Tax=unclassified Aurantimonas TaxID=2638230 RepID=UPI002E178EE5|nr:MULTISPECIES: glycosyltransferase family 4 protein [unclassified Aurantimonas]MEC5293411.1 glycosyltransferase family 4 protein [Aurantimonas sp. C2-3-R2]MEC5383567.1 glycosyltransferase family 4 protein [Aurantimonas sp. C2-6-R+9]MEC5414492.1 glycosyltransferase family 4 protein [Aurantimonas sp. C2-4-R8]
MLAPIAWRVPPRNYGPWERVVSLLTEGLVAAGVDVTLFATADSCTSARLSAVVPSPYEETPGLDAKVWEGLHLANAFGQAANFDLIHNHYDFLPLTYASLVDTPTITTIHGFSSEGILPVYRAFNGRTTYVSISDADRHPDLTYLATIHHGLNFGEFTFQDLPGEYLLFFGRIHPDKGASDAIRVARAANRPLVLAGIVQDQGYFERKVEPHLGDRVRYVGPVGPSERDTLLGGALGLLHLIHFDEPFGLSVVEAMACGTPVIAYPRGSMAEVIAHGVSGILAPDEAGAVHAVKLLHTLDRSNVRAHAERFTAARMVDAYLHAYHAVLSSGPRPPALKDDADEGKEHGALVAEAIFRTP